VKEDDALGLATEGNSKSNFEGIKLDSQDTAQVHRNHADYNVYRNPDGSPMNEYHAKMLAGSGIPPEHAVSRGYETIVDSRRLAAIGIVKSARKCVPGLLIPLLRCDGSTWGYQYRPDLPRLDSKGKPIKYETPYQQGNGLDIPPGMGDLLDDPCVPLWVTEGTKKADCGAQYQLCIVALSGVWNWRGTNDMGGKAAVGGWNDIALNGRRVIIAFDGDLIRKPSAAKALCALADFLKSRGANVEYLHLPDDGEHKVGLDDHLVGGHTAEDLWRLVKPDQPPVPDDQEPPRPTPEPPPEFGSIDGAALLEYLRAWFGRYIVVVAATDLCLLALWVAHTFLSRELYTTPRLLIDSITPGSGKTTLLEHLDRLCLNAMLAVSMSSAALIPRILEKESRTVLLDEVQRTLVEGRPETDAVLAVVNSGYRAGATRPVLTRQGDDWVPKELPTFAPMAMAGNSPHLPQDTVDRSIRILLMPDPDGRAEDSDWEALDGEVKELHRRVALWADSVRAHVKETRGDLPPGCVGRLREKWRPLMRVGELADWGTGHFWKDTVYAMAKDDFEDMQAQREAGLRQQTPGLVLLQDLAQVWPKDTPFMATEELIELLVGHNPDYWGPGLNFGGSPRKKLNATRLGRMVKQATNTTSRRPGGGGTPRGYERVQFERAWQFLRIDPPGSRGDAGAHADA